MWLCVTGVIALSIGRPNPEFILSDEDRATLERWTARQKTSQALALRARVLLKSAENIANSAVASHLGVTKATVGKWRNRFIAKGVAGLLDEPRVGAPGRVSDEDVERVVTTTLDSALAAGISRTTVHRVWQSFARRFTIASPCRGDTDPGSRLLQEKRRRRFVGDGNLISGTGTSGTRKIAPCNGNGGRLSSQVTALLGTQSTL